MNNKKILKNIQLFVFFVVLIACYQYVIEHKSELHILFTIERKFIFPVAIFMLFNIFISTVHFFLNLRNYNHKIQFLPFFKTNIIGTMMDLFFQQGGNVYRASYFKIRKEINLKNYFSALIVTKWQITLYSGIVGIFVAYTYQPMMVIKGIPLLFLFITQVVICLLILLVIFSTRFIALKDIKIQHLHSILRKMITELQRFYLSIHGHICSIRNSIEQILLIILSLFLVMFAIFFGFKCVGITIDFQIALLFAICLRLSNIFIITPQNIGVREFFFGLIAESVGQSFSVGISVSIIFRFVILAVKVFLAVILILMEKLCLTKYYIERND